MEFQITPASPVSSLFLVGLTVLMAVMAVGFGWFKLANGEKALVALSSRDRVVYVPTDEGYSLLFSLERPEAFLEHAGRMKRGS